MTFTMLDGKGPLHCGFIPVVLSPVRKGVGLTPGNVGEVAMREIRLDTGAISKVSQGTKSGVEEANLLWLQPQHPGSLCKP